MVMTKEMEKKPVQLTSQVIVIMQFLSFKVNVFGLRLTLYNCNIRLVYSFNIFKAV